METQIILAMLLQRYRFELRPGSQVVREPELSLHQKGEIWLQVTPA